MPDDSHKNSDRDSSPWAIHHTLGPRRNQASPGDHTHDGGTSLELSQIPSEEDIENIAEEVAEIVSENVAEDVFASHIQWGSELMSFAAAGSHIRTISIPTRPAAPEVVLVIINSGSGVPNGWVWKTDQYTTNSFRLTGTGPNNGAWSNINLLWVAFYA